MNRWCKFTRDSLRKYNVKNDSKNTDIPKKIKFVNHMDKQHWVGDGFHVYGLIRPDREVIPYINPFVLLDYAPPKAFPPSKQQRGVGEHPHRGFETVTLAYQGEVEHRDSSGAGGKIQPGDVQWMTAGKGVVHEEFHSKEFSHKGGMFEMVQLWINLPAKHKMTSPKYQEIKAQDIPSIHLSEHTILRIIAGHYAAKQGPAATFTPIHLFDMQSSQTDNLQITLKENTNTILIVLSGSIELEGQKFHDKSTLIFEKNGNHISFATSEDFRGIVLNGDDLNEPVVAHGPFVMNSEQEIIEAIHDYKNGKMGQLTSHG